MAFHISPPIPAHERAYLGVFVLTAALCLSAPAYDIADYFVLTPDSAWYYEDFDENGGAVDADSNFRWTVEQQTESVHEIEATRVRTDADDETAQQHGDVAFWSINSTGQLLSHGMYKGNPAPPLSGDQTVYLSQPVIIGERNMDVGWQRKMETTATILTDSFGTRTVTVRSTVELVAELAVKETPLRVFKNVLVLHVKLEAEDYLPFIGKVTEILQDSLLFLAPGYGVVAQSEDLSPQSPYSHALSEGRIGARAIPAAEPPAGLVVNITDSTSSESGDPASFSISLASVPTAAVTLFLSSLDETEGVIQEGSSSVSFTPTTWDVPHSVQVIGRDDHIHDGDVAYGISITPFSEDITYAQLSPAPVQLENLDNDVPDVVLRRINPESSESGGTAVLEVVLATEPFHEVTVVLSSTDTSEGLVENATNTATLVFDPAQWNVPQTVYVHGQDDAVDDGDIVYHVTADVTSEDMDYHGFQVVAAELLNVNNDFTVAGNLSYNGRQSGRVYVRLYAGELLNDPPIAEADSDDVFDFAFTPLPAGSYTLIAFRDSDADGEIDPTEPVGIPVVNPFTLGPSLQTPVALIDSDDDEDMLPDWWEIEVFGGLAMQSGEDDPDNDGLTNLEEYALSSDPLGWRVEFTANTASIAPLKLGMQTEASAAGNDQWDQPASLGQGSIAWFSSANEGPLARDIRDVSDEASWTLVVSAHHDEAEDVVISWVAAAIPKDRVLQMDELDEYGDLLENGIQIDMTAAAEIAVAPGATRYLRLTFRARQNQEILLHEGWNAVSLYVKPLDPQPSAVFGDHIEGPALYWNGRGYTADEQLRPCRGYWVFRKSGAGSVSFQVEGRPLRYADSLATLEPGWCFRGPATPTQIPRLEGLQPKAWLYDGSKYLPVSAEDTLEPGRAYWFHASGESPVLLDTAIYGPGN